MKPHKDKIGFTVLADGWEDKTVWSPEFYRLDCEGLTAGNYLLLRDQHGSLYLLFKTAQATKAGDTMALCLTERALQRPQNVTLDGDDLI